MRRLPVYLLIDISGSMRGESIVATNNALQTMIACLQQEPNALESVYMSILTFNREINEFLPLTELEVLQFAGLPEPESGPTLLGKALDFLVQKINSNAVKSSKKKKGDWDPLLFIITDGKVSDRVKFNQVLEKVKNFKFTSIVICLTGHDGHEELLKKLTGNIYSLETMDGAAFIQFFDWVSQSILKEVKEKTYSSNSNLPLPPAEIKL